MKKYCYFIASTALLAMASSCTSDLEVSENGPNRHVEVTFSAKLPSTMASRAVSDGQTVNRLNYAAYWNDGSKWTLAASGEKTNAFAGTSLTEENITLSLLAGESYKVVFWADYANGAEVYYTFDKNSSKVSAVWDTANPLANDERLDAFYAVDPITVNGAISKTIQLYRPFAQINFGSSDATSSDIDMSKTQITIDANAYQTFDILNDELSDQKTTELTYNLNDSPSGDITVNSKDYAYVAYAYLFSKQEDLTKVTLTINSGQSCEVTNVPVKRNYKTNIVGNLFTAGVTYTVQISPDYEEPDNDIEIVWDGTSTTPVTPVATQIDGNDVQLYTVTTPAELAWIATEGPTTADTYIALENNVNMDNNLFPGFGTSNRKGNAAEMFNGTFDGKGYTIENFKVQSTGDDHVAGLIPTAYNATIKNVKMNNVTADADYDCTAALVGFTSGTKVTISDCEITNINVKSADTAGGIVGKVYAETTEITNCKVSGGTISGLKCAGIVGHSAYAKTGNVTITNCENSANIISTYKEDKTSIAGGICGMIGTGAIITNCTNTGNVTAHDYCASMIGYYSFNATDPTWITKIEGNTNTGNLKSQGSLATMVALIRTPAKLSFVSNTNNGNYNKSTVAEFNNDTGVEITSQTGYTNNGQYDENL